MVVPVPFFHPEYQEPSRTWAESFNVIYIKGFLDSISGPARQPEFLRSMVITSDHRSLRLQVRRTERPAKGSARIPNV